MLKEKGVIDIKRKVTDNIIASVLTKNRCISRMCYYWEFAGSGNCMGMISISLSTDCFLHTQTSE